MKIKIALLCICMMFVLSCKKDGKNDSSDITGRWKLSETLADPGDGSGKWRKAESTDYIQFFADGKLISDSYKEYTSYKLTDSANIAFSKDDKTIQNFRFTLKDGTLSLSPNGPIFCIEGCGVRYKRAN